MEHEKRRPGAHTRVDGRHTAAPLKIPGKQTLVEATRGAARPRTLKLADVAGAGGGTQAWDTLFDGEHHAVQKAGRIQAERGVKLHARPALDTQATATLKFNTAVVVQRESGEPVETDRWCFVTAADGSAGFCQRAYVTTDMPECTAKLHLVQSGETLGGIAKRHYGSHMKGGNDARLYVHALYIANKGRVGIQLTDSELSAKDTLLRGKSEEETLEIYRSVQVLAETALWIPSSHFVDELKSKGKITSGSTVVSEAWRDAKGAVSHAIDHVVETAGLVAGLLEGAGEAIYDMVAGAVEMTAAVAKIVFKLLTGDFGGIVGMGKKWIKDLSETWSDRGAIKDGFLAKWNAEDPFQRGRFRGEVIGWVLTTILMIVLTAGEATAGAVAIIATKFPTLVGAMKTVGTLGDATKWAGDAAKGAKKLGSSADDLIRTRVRDAETKARRQRERDRARGREPEDDAGTNRGQQVVQVLDKIKRATEITSLTLQKQGIAPALYTLVKPTTDFLNKAGDRAEDENLDGWVLQKEDSRGEHREVMVHPRAMRRLERDARKLRNDGNRDVRTRAKDVLHLTDGSRDRLGVDAELSGSSLDVVLVPIRGRP